eukprot:5577836-Alexandrium_andersonii.AAC.1
MLRPFLGPRGKRFCMFGAADCGLRRIAALVGREPIGDCTWGALLCEDPSFHDFLRSCWETFVATPWGCLGVVGER